MNREPDAEMDRVVAGPASGGESGQASSCVRHVAVSDACDGQRVDNFLLRLAPGVPRSHVYRLLRTGQVRVNGGRVKPASRLVAGDKVRVPPMQLKPASQARVPDALCEQLADRIIAETDDWLVLDKPVGLAVHGGTGLAFGLIDALRQLRAAPELELVHRLDRDTSGVLLVARDAGRGRALQQLFRERAVYKQYLALLDGKIRDDEFSVAAPLLANKAHAGERRVVVATGGAAALSHFRVMQRFAEATLVEVRIETGRTHQIRVHALHSGHPVVGDQRYTDNRRNARFRQRGLKRLFLHAQVLGFEWQGDAVELRVEPDDRWRLCLEALATT